MNDKELCKALGLTIHKLRVLIKALDIKSISKTREKRYTLRDRARLKAGIQFRDYLFVADENTPWIFYVRYQGTDSTAIQEIKIEV